MGINNKRYLTEFSGGLLIVLLATTWGLVNHQGTDLGSSFHLVTAINAMAEKKNSVSTPCLRVELLSTLIETHKH